MTTWLDQLLVSFFIAVFAAMVGYIAAFRPTIAIAFLFILITLLWRTAATAYIDLAGPVLSSQLLRNIGPGMATVPQTIAYLLTLLPFFFFFNPGRVATWSRAPEFGVGGTRWVTLTDVILIMSALFLIALYTDLARRGVVPLFEKMERFVYTGQYAGPFHRFLIRYGDLLVGFWGVMFAARKLREDRLDFRFVALLVIAFIYLFLTGNRFSALYSFGTFFIAPYAAVVAVSATSGPFRRPFEWLTRIFSRREIGAVVVVLVVALAVSAVGIYNNLVNVRADDPVSPEVRFKERVLIQPSEIGWVSYRRVFIEGHSNPGAAANLLFVNPIDPARNTTIQYLMSETIGEPRTNLHLSSGLQFAGGFPEIFFELFGPYLAWPFLLAAGWMTAALTATFIRAVVEGHYLTSFFAAYVLYGFQIMYIGGMLNFVQPWTFWLKLCALLLAVVIERSLNALGYDLIPWRIIRMPGTWIRRNKRALEKVCT